MMRRRLPFFAALSFISLLIPAGLAQASITFFGGSINCSNGWDCTLCAGVSVIQLLINFIIIIAFPIAALLFTYAGGLIFTSSANPGGIKKGLDIFTSVGIGFAFVLCGWLIVDTIVHTVIINQNPQYFQNHSWNSVGSCVATNAQRQTQLSVAQLLFGVFSPNGSTFAPGPEGGAFSCPAGTERAGAAGCANTTTHEFVIPNGYSCPAGGTFDPSSGGCSVCTMGGCDIIAPTPGGVIAPLSSYGGNGCDATIVSQAATQAGYSLTSSQSSALACISQGEDACGNGKVTNFNWGNGSSAAGAYQVLMQSHSACWDNSVCEQAAGTSASLNCGSAFAGGNPKTDPTSLATVQKCLQAAASVQCSAAAAACLVKQNPSMSDWASPAANTCKSQNGI